MDPNVSYDVRPDDSAPTTALHAPLRPARPTTALHAPLRPARAARRSSVTGVAAAIGWGVDGDGRHGDGSLEALRAGEIVGRRVSVHLVTQLGKTRQPGFGFYWLIHGNHEPVDGHTAIPALFFARHRRGLSGFCRILSVLGGSFQEFRTGLTSWSVDGRVGLFHPRRPAAPRDRQRFGVGPPEFAARAPAPGAGPGTIGPGFAPVHRSEPGPDFVDRQHAMELSECIGREWGLVSEADDEHEPCLPSGGGESDGRGGRRDSFGRIRSSVGP